MYNFLGIDAGGPGARYPYGSLFSLWDKMGKLGDRDFEEILNPQPWSFINSYIYIKFNNLF